MRFDISQILFRIEQRASARGRGCHITCDLLALGPSFVADTLVVRGVSGQPEQAARRRVRRPTGHKSVTFPNTNSLLLLFQPGRPAWASELFPKCGIGLGLLV